MVRVDGIAMNRVLRQTHTPRPHAACCRLIYSQSTAPWVKSTTRLSTTQTKYIYGVLDISGFMKGQSEVRKTHTHTPAHALPLIYQRIRDVWAADAGWWILIIQLARVVKGDSYVGVLYGDGWQKWFVGINAKILSWPDLFGEAIN